jgi:hypothetical protein
VTARGQPNILFGVFSMGMPGVEQAIAWQYEMSRQRDGTAAYLR